MEKIKFKVLVSGHQWSSARHLQETLHNFSIDIQVIEYNQVLLFDYNERNAHKLGYLKESETISCLQLVESDGSEPEDLDVEATLGDVIICMGNKQLVAVVSTNKPSLEVTSCANTLDNSQASIIANTTIAKNNDRAKKDQVDSSLLATNDFIDQPNPIKHISLSVRPSSKLIMPSAKGAHSGVRWIQQKLVCTPKQIPSEHQSMSHPSQMQDLSRVYSKTDTDNQPSQMLLKRSRCFQSFAKLLLSRFPLLHTQNTESPQDGKANLMLLEQFLSSQRKLLVSSKKTKTMAINRLNPIDKLTTNATYTKEVPKITVTSNNNDCVLAQEKETRNYIVENITNEDLRARDLRPTSINENSESPLLSIGVNNFVDNDVEIEHRDCWNEIVYLVKRRSKNGVGPYAIRMSDLAMYFHLSVIDAAKKLGVSLTSLKNACRKLGIKRWPGRKVRSLENTIQGVEDRVAVGEGAGLAELVDTLQHERNQLVRGTPAEVTHTMYIMQQSCKTAEAYRRLYSRGWRSRNENTKSQHSINNQNNGSIELPMPRARKNKKVSKATKHANGKKGSRKRGRSKDDVVSKKAKKAKKISKCRVKEDSNNKVELAKEEARHGAPISDLVAELLEKNGVNIDLVSSERGVIVEEEKQTTCFVDSDSKHPRQECKIATKETDIGRLILISSSSESDC